VERTSEAKTQNDAVTRLSRFIQLSVFIDALRALFAAAWHSLAHGRAGSLASFVSTHLSRHCATLNGYRRM